MCACFSSSPPLRNSTNFIQYGSNAVPNSESGLILLRIWLRNKYHNFYGFVACYLDNIKRVVNRFGFGDQPVNVHLEDVQMRR